MVELPLEWVEKADVLIDDAERHLREGHYWLTCFEAQQAAELYLEALIVALTGTHPFTHDLAELLEALRELDISVPDELFVYADALTPHYTMARYPGRKPLRYDRELGERCLRYARRIIDWVKEAASKIS
ncbi:HEPN domain-containing protein [Pyrofollis japonicus]|uniref:HEPN domain-containing protein n=1 Tax=Pyrofollis japonicus TaxID=3060460 RepID=UPI00295B1D0B|nr:HEPN domain-containing protein [Pyrofollis japonicus]BEP16727.1 HEPN domain-containing protein [Pyrofollis japonicus]